MSWLSLSTSPGKGKEPKPIACSAGCLITHVQFPQRNFSLEPEAGWEQCRGPCRDSGLGNIAVLGQSRPMKVLLDPHCAHSNGHRGVKSTLHLKPLQPVRHCSCCGGPAHPRGALEALGWLWGWQRGGGTAFPWDG